MDKSKLALGQWKNRLNDDQILILHFLRRNGYKFIVKEVGDIITAFKSYPVKIPLSEDGEYLWTDCKKSWIFPPEMEIKPCYAKEMYERDNHEEFQCGYNTSQDTGMEIDDCGEWKDEWFKEKKILHISEMVSRNRENRE